MAFLNIQDINSLNELKSFDRIDYRTYIIKTLLNCDSIPKPMIVQDPKDNHIEKTDDIRLLLDKRNFNIKKIISHIGGKLVYIKSGTTGHTFKAVSDVPNTVNYAVKVVAYPKKDNYGNIYDPVRPENAELILLRLLSYFVINEETPHIVLPFCTFNTSIQHFTTLGEKKIIENDKYDAFLEKYKEGCYYSDVSILLSEWANKGDLLDYIRKNYKTMTFIEWKVIIFQLLSVLSIVQLKYPSFRHNDLKANNILLQEVAKKNKVREFLYTIDSKEFEVPNIGYQIKIWDFDFACIPNIADNAKVSSKWTNRINVKPRKNKYYDMHYFFNTLTMRGFFPDFWTSPYVDKRIKYFVRRIIPKEYRSGDFVSKRGRLLKNVEYVTPIDVINHDPLFQDFRVK